jgi:hypothetical protein
VVGVLTEFPKTIQAGLSLRAEIEAIDYPAPTWSVSAHLRGPASIDIAATGEVELHSFAVTGAETAAYAPGLYMVSVRATDGVDVFELESGQVEILADVASLDAGHDPRVHAEKVLDAIEAVLEGRASKDQQSYTINGRTLVRTSIAELLQLRKTYQDEVAKLKSGGRSRRILRRQVKVVM